METLDLLLPSHFGWLIIHKFKHKFNNIIKKTIFIQLGMTWLFLRRNTLLLQPYSFLVNLVGSFIDEVKQNLNNSFSFPTHSPINTQLAWFHKDRHTLLALHDSVIVKNGRISVRSHANTTFYLTIHDVREEDRGSYMCQLNTVPMRGQVGHLEVNGQ